MSAYPATAAARDAFVVARRPARLHPDPWRAHGVSLDREPDAAGSLADVLTVFLTGRECPWRCAMCDLWRFTTIEDTPSGAIPHQIHAAIAEADAAGSNGRPLRHIKLYNAGSFFDPRAVPVADYPRIASAVSGFSRVIVESHPALVGARVDRLAGSLASESAKARRHAGPIALEVAMGLETAHPEALARLNKRMNVDDFREAAAALVERDVDVRAFVLVAPPFVPAAEQADWLRRSIAVAFDAGASVVSLIPMRGGNGTIEALEAGEFTPPTLESFEAAFEDALSRRLTRQRIFADVWDLSRFSRCPRCLDARVRRLVAMNESQRVSDRVSCDRCEGGEVRP